MAYTIRIKRSARKELAAIPLPQRRRIAAKSDALGENPRPQGARKLRGTQEAAYRIRVGDYRIIYLIEDDRLVVCVMSIGHRKDVYRKR